MTERVAGRGDFLSSSAFVDAAFSSLHSRFSSAASERMLSLQRIESCAVFVFHFEERRFAPPSAAAWRRRSTKASVFAVAFATAAVCSIFASLCWRQHVFDVWRSAACSPPEVRSSPLMIRLPDIERQLSRLPVFQRQPFPHSSHLTLQAITSRRPFLAFSPCHALDSAEASCPTGIIFSHDSIE